MKATALSCLAAALGAVLAACGGSGGTTPGPCSLSIAGAATASGLTCASVVSAGGASETLRVQNVADPPAQPLSVQMLCADASLTARTYGVAGATGTGGCTVLVQQFAADRTTVTRRWQVQPGGAGTMSVTLTDVHATDGGAVATGSGTATAPEVDVTTGAPITGSDLMLTFSF